MREGGALEWKLLILQGPRGEGKTTGAIMACLALAEDLRVKGYQGLPLQVAVVRDTWENLKRTTLVAFEQNRAKGMPLEVFDGGKQAVAGHPGQPLVHFWFFGLERREDVDRLQGFTCGVLWLEEVAPAAGLATGVPQEALGLGATSVRQEGVPKRILVTLNPPDEDHWILKVEKVLADSGLALIKIRRFEMEPGEKSQHFRALATLVPADEAGQWSTAADEFDAYRTANEAFLLSIGRGDLVARLVRGEMGFAQPGEAVVPTFSKLLHVSQLPLPVYKGLPIFRFWDAGTGDLHPACVFAQANPPGWLNILASVSGENVGILEFIRDQVLPLQRKYGWMPPKATLGGGFGGGAAGGFQFRDIGDPACLVPSGISSQLTVGKEIQVMLGTAFEPGPQDWTTRREVLLEGFSRPGRGDRSRMIQIDPDENSILIRALAGRFHYPRDLASGRIQGTVEAAKRASGLYSHPVMALAYGLAILFPPEDWARPPAMPKGPPPGPRAKSWLGT